MVEGISTHGCVVEMCLFSQCGLQKGTAHVTVNLPFLSVRVLWTLERERARESPALFIHGCLSRLGRVYSLCGAMDMLRDSHVRRIDGGLSG